MNKLTLILVITFYLALIVVYVVRCNTDIPQSVIIEQETIEHKIDSIYDEKVNTYDTLPIVIKYDSTFAKLKDRYNLR